MLRALLFGILVIGLAGCAAKPHPVPDAAVLPADFAVDLTIVSGHAPEPGAVAQVQPGRYVVFPDGTLHHGITPPPGSPADTPPAGWLPSVSRFLQRDQVESLWALSVDLGLGDPAQADPLVNFNLIEARKDQTLYLLALTAHGKRWNFVQSAEDPSMGPDVAPLARALADLAWVADGYEPPAIIIPKRYDFGPDPYAQYRR